MITLTSFPSPQIMDIFIRISRTKHHCSSQNKSHTKDNIINSQKNPVCPTIIIVYEFVRPLYPAECHMAQRRVETARLSPESSSMPSVIENEKVPAVLSAPPRTNITDYLSSDACSHYGGTDLHASKSPLTDAYSA